MNLPNKLSITRICLVPIFMLFAIPLPAWDWLSGINSFMHSFGIYIAGVIFIIASITDSIDGYIARSRNMVTDFGKFIDPIADKLLVTAAVIALVQLGVLNGWLAMIIVGRELLITGFRLVVSGKGVVLSANIWGKLKTVMQTIAISLLLFEIKFREIFSWYPKEFFLGDAIMLIAVILTVISAYIYVKDSAHLLKEHM